jgi:uncharacterized integral membrane protein
MSEPEGREQAAAAPNGAANAPVSESRRERLGRHSHRTRLYLTAAVLVACLVLIVVLVVENTRQVRVGWVFGYSTISLVYLVVFATVLGWILGVATSIVFHRRTRTRPRARRGS